jgi:hypothetical protein
VPSSAIAPHVAGWQLRLGGQAGPWSGASASGDASGGTGANGLLVELLVDGSWVDITSRVMVRDSGGNIAITRGQSSEGQQPNPGTCSFQLNNRDGLFSPANPISPYYGRIGRNTQIRVSVAKGDDKSYRFWGEVTAWPEDWDTTDTDIWVDIEAAGILRRLSQGTTPLRSTLYRGLMSAATTTPVAYWPMEDAAGASFMTSALGGPNMQIGGAPSLSADSGFACSASLPTMNNGAFVGPVPSYAVTGQTQVRWLMYLPSAPANGTVLVQATGTGTVAMWTVTYGTGGSLSTTGYDRDGNIVAGPAPVGFALDGTDRIRVSLELTQNGTTGIDWALSVINATTGSIGGLSGTFATVTVGRIIAVTVTPAGTLADAVFGHVSVQNDVTSVFDLAGQVTAFKGEVATTRLARLCTEEGINFTNIRGLSADAMGPQLPNTFLALVQECVDVDQGVFYERDVAFGLAYRPRAVLYNSPATLTLSYPGHQLSDTPKPVPDDQNVKNSVTASRPDGASTLVELETGRLSIQPPPLGVGTYPDTPSLNVLRDDDLLQHAAWRVHLGTVDEPRYPAISINLAHPSMAAQRFAALDVLPGSRIVVQSPPSRLGGDISQIVIGSSETITHFEHRIVFVGEPESPYHVGVVEDAVLGKVDSEDSYLAGDMTPTQASVLVSIATSTWVTDPVQFPFDVTIAGEQMTVTGVTGASSPQLFALTRSVNGVVKTHQAGEQVRLTHPAVIAL